MAGEQGRCPNCGSDQVVRAGKYNRGEKGVEQRYLYRSWHRFTTRPVQQLELI
jgi:transposase-like protein